MKTNIQNRAIVACSSYSSVLPCWYFDSFAEKNETQQIQIQNEAKKRRISNHQTTTNGSVRSSPRLKYSTAATIPLPLGRTNSESAVQPNTKKTSSSAVKGSSPFISPSQLKRKRSHNANSRLSGTKSHQITVDSLVPLYECELALNAKKLEELKRWLQSKMVVHRGPKTLLVTGPSGSGKLTALRVLCSELGIEVNEFDWTEQLEDWIADTSGRRQHLDGFMRFLDANEFSSVQRMSLKHRLLLISQLPHAFIHDPTKLYVLLADVAKCSRCMLVFVLAQVDSCWELNPVRMFPPSVVEKFQMAHIKFNAVPNTLMTAALKRAFALLNVRWNAEKARKICSTAKGDIRRAMNKLLFSLVGKRATKYGRTTENALCDRPPQLADHTPIELFHYIGKVMYAKRETVAGEKWQQLESLLRPAARLAHSRPFPPKEELNELVAASPIPAQMLVDYVFEHEPQFAPRFRAQARIASVAAGLDVMQRNTFNCERVRLMDKYAEEIIIRCALFYNYRPADAPGVAVRRSFYQFEGSHLRKMDLQRTETRLCIAECFAGQRSAQLNTIILPLMPLLRPVCTSSAQFDLFSRLTLSPAFAARLRLVPQHSSSTRAQTPPMDIVDVVPCSPEPSNSQMSIISVENEHDTDNDRFSCDIEETEEDY